MPSDLRAKKPPSLGAIQIMTSPMAGTFSGRDFPLLTVRNRIFHSGSERNSVQGVSGSVLAIRVITEESPCRHPNNTHDGETTHQAVSGGESAVLDLESGFQDFEVHLNPPPQAIPVHFLARFLEIGDRQIGEQHPLDGLFVLGGLTS